jgi:hypothetical protein
MPRRPEPTPAGCCNSHGRQTGNWPEIHVTLGTELRTIILHLPANVVSKGLSVTNTTRQHFLFFEMTYSVGNRLCEQKMRPPAHHLHFEVFRAIRDPSARHRRPFSTYPGTEQRLASNYVLTGHRRGAIPLRSVCITLAAWKQLLFVPNVLGCALAIER